MANDDQIAEQNARADDAAGQVRDHLIKVTSATLCTLSVKREVEGFPFGSIVPFALDDAGRPVIYTARIAAHTANLLRDPRASLFVSQPDVHGDPQAGWRVTVMGKLAPLDTSEGERARIAARYFERVPDARSYSQTHGFGFWHMHQVTLVRYIGGFGKICWLQPGEILRADDQTRATSRGAVEHMNDDHRENMVEMCRGLYGLEVERATMVALDATGFLLEADGAHLWFSFGREVAPNEVRHAVVDVLKRARAKGG